MPQADASQRWVSVAHDHVQSPTVLLTHILFRLIMLTQVVLAGSFAFDIIDRIGGATLNIGPPKWVIDYIVVPLLNPPDDDDDIVIVHTTTATTTTTTRMTMPRIQCRCCADEDAWP
eukprot:1642947-Rhodomonas_salina.2